MVEVAIESLKAVLPQEEILPGTGSYRQEETAAPETEMQAAAAMTE